MSSVRMRIFGTTPELTIVNDKLKVEIHVSLFELHKLISNHLFLVFAEHFRNSQSVANPSSQAL